MKARDYRLVIEGRFNRVAIMQRAWAIVRIDKRVGLKTSFASALKKAWNDARVKMDEYRISQKPWEFNTSRQITDLYFSSRSSLATGTACR